MDWTRASFVRLPAFGVVPPLLVEPVEGSGWNVGKLNRTCSKNRPRSNIVTSWEDNRRIISLVSEIEEHYLMNFMMEYSSLNTCDFVV